MPSGGWRSAALLAAVFLLALAVNHDAYRGYFEDDDLATLTWIPKVPLWSLANEIPSLDYARVNRPPGFIYFGTLWRRYGLTYPPFAIVLQIVAALNVVLLWLLLRRSGLEPLPCAAACLFFGLHRALFDGWWKPMFVYDVMCTLFTLTSILLYLGRHWVLSFVAYWLAFRAKEIAIVLPVILLCYEMLLGQKKWMRTIPFFIPALIYGGFGLAFNLRQHSLYGFRFTLPALWKSASFYASRLLWIPYAGFLFLLLPLFLRDRRLLFGLAMMLLGLSMYLLLSEKLSDVYIYLAATGAAMAVAVLARQWPRSVWALLAIWILWQIRLTRQHAAETLADAGDRRAFFAAAKQVPDSPIYVYDVVPASMHSWGVEATMYLQHPGDPKSHALGVPWLPAKGSMVLLSWDPRTRQIDAAPFAPLSAVYMPGDRPIPRWQLVSGWGPEANGYRPIGRRATARLFRPEHTDDFVWDACASGPVELRTFIEGEEFPRIKFKSAECVPGHGRMLPGKQGVVILDFLVGPENKVRIGSFGFR